MRVFVILTLVLGARCCPDGWIQHSLSCYHFSHDLETWPGADYMCEKMGGKLVEIETAAENAYLTPIVDSQKHNYWIGLSDVQEEGIWMWMESKEKLSTTGFSHWYPNQPDNSEANENCATINFDVGGKWNDWHCNGKEANYICEKDRETDVVG
ncbi:perlucin-like protein [Mercenaria mercenaria]|uniref:perlucin-like protein n=1 Tax=Mercenaria mercenaria TaxID=6596 RepID=UPI00234F5649|nr:perlucin-like protein [Mercenaria mercenaria]